MKKHHGAIKKKKKKKTKRKMKEMIEVKEVPYVESMALSLPHHSPAHPPHLHTPPVLLLLLLLPLLLLCESCCSCCSCFSSFSHSPCPRHQSFLSIRYSNRLLRSGPPQSPARSSPQSHPAGVGTPALVTWMPGRRGRRNPGRQSQCQSSPGTIGERMPAAPAHGIPTGSYSTPART